MIYIVLGMHKSGTTLISEILHHSGINMIENFNPQMNYDQGNFYERKAAQVLNREILKVGRFHYGFSSLELVAPDKLEASADLRDRIRDFIQVCNSKHQSWGFKDPVNCLTYPVWNSELPEHKIIAIYRSPCEIWPRYRNRIQFYGKPHGAWKFVNRWCEYNSAILAAIRKNKSNSILLSYHRLMADQIEFDRLQKFVGHNLLDRRTKKMWRNRPKKDSLFHIAWWLAGIRTDHMPSDIVRKLANIHYKQRIV